MSYHDTIQEDIERAKLIINDDIIGSQKYAACEILKSFIEEIEFLHNKRRDEMDLFVKIADFLEDQLDDDVRCRQLFRDINSTINTWHER